MTGAATAPSAVAPSSRFSKSGKALIAYGAIIAVTLIGCEMVLRIVNPEALQVVLDEKNLTYAHDPELGWLPVPNSKTKVTVWRTISVWHNELGFRDAALSSTDKRDVVAFVGDSFVWGYDVEQDQRFTELLQRQLPQIHVVNAGVSGFGTDQEYLLLKRDWDRLAPATVVLIFCTNNDRLDNSSSQRYGYYKPYYVANADGTGEFKGIPTPLSKNFAFGPNIFARFARHSMLARLALTIDYAFAHPAAKQEVADPTEALIVLMKDWVESHGAKFLVGVQTLDNPDRAFETFLRERRIPFAALDGADHFPVNEGSHWTPEGHVLVAQRLLTLLRENLPSLQDLASESQNVPPNPSVSSP